MNRVEGNCKQMKGIHKEQWGKLTDDDLTTSSRASATSWKVRSKQRKGYEKDQSKRDIDDWYGNQTW